MTQTQSDEKWVQGTHRKVREFRSSHRRQLQRGLERRLEVRGLAFGHPQLLSELVDLSD